MNDQEQPLPSRELLPSRHLFPQAARVTEAYDFTQWALERAEESSVATHHVDFLKALVKLADISRQTDAAFATTAAAKWLDMIDGLGAWLETNEPRYRVSDTRL